MEWLDFLKLSSPLPSGGQLRGSGPNWGVYRASFLQPFKKYFLEKETKVCKKGCFFEPIVAVLYQKWKNWHFLVRYLFLVLILPAFPATLQPTKSFLHPSHHFIRKNLEKKIIRYAKKAGFRAIGAFLDLQLKDI